MDRDMTGGTTGGFGAQGNVGGVGGAGEVRTRISTNPTEVDVHASGRVDASGAREEAGNVIENARDRAEELVGDARDKARDLGNRATEYAGQAQDRLEDLGVLNVIRDHPLPALGVAFGVGYLLAGRPEPRSRTGRIARGAKKQLKGAVIGSLGAMVMQEVQGMLGLGGGDDQDEEFEGRSRTTGRSRGMGGSFGGGSLGGRSRGMGSTGGTGGLGSTGLGGTRSGGRFNEF